MFSRICDVGPQKDFLGPLFKKLGNHSSFYEWNLGSNRTQNFLSARIWNSFLVLLGCPFGPQCAATLLFAEMYVAGGCMCQLLKKKHRLSTFLRLCPWDLHKNNNNTEINGMKFKRGCFDKIDWNTCIPDWGVNENKRLEIGSTGSFSGVLLFSFFLFSLFFWF